jgi:toxin ParE1/3/4
MGNRYSLFIYPMAEEDMERIFEYISKDLYAPESAIKLINKFYTALENVRSFPFSFPLTLNIALRDKNIRKLCIESYIIFY